MSNSAWVPEIKTKMSLAAERLGIKKQSDWLEYFSYSDTTSISRIFNGKNGIRKTDLSRISTALNISDKDFFSLPREFGELIGLDDFQINQILSVSHATKNYARPLKDSDSEILNKLHGTYFALYYCREMSHILDHYIAVEKFEIERPYPQNDYCSVRQISNLMTGENPTGHLKVRGGRLNICITYESGDYADSNLLLRAIILESELKILSGLYMDISTGTDSDIFCTNIVLFSCAESIELKRKYKEDDCTFDILKEMFNLDPYFIENKRILAIHGSSHNEKLRSAIAKVVDLEKARGGAD